jgi:cysteine synthase A
VRLRRLVPSEHAAVYVKCEFFNPMASVKDRIAEAMIAAGEREGRVTPDTHIIEPTSGNTGIALAFVAAARGYSCTLVMPSTMSIERRRVLKALGARLILTDGAKGMPAAIAKAEEIAATDPARYFMPQQFSNPANPRIHEDTTGPDIWRDTDGAIDVLVCGVGTGGTLTGISRYIKHTCGKAITTVAVEPSTTTVITAAKAGTQHTHAPHKIQGIGAGFLPDNLDLDLVDQVEQVTSEDAMAWAHKLMQQEGILAGISCGAAMAVADRVSRQPQHQGKNIVVVLPDSAERYLSTALFEGMWDEPDIVQ